MDTTKIPELQGDEKCTCAEEFCDFEEFQIIKYNYNVDD